MELYIPFGSEDKPKKKKTGEVKHGVCPVCGSQTVMQAGCETCPVCGWSKCTSA